MWMEGEMGEGCRMGLEGVCCGESGQESSLFSRRCQRTTVGSFSNIAQ